MANPASVFYECQGGKGVVRDFSRNAESALNIRDNCAQHATPTFLGCFDTSGNAFVPPESFAYVLPNPSFPPAAQVTCKATDGFGNTSSGDLGIYVIDTSGPTITQCPNNVTLECNGKNEFGSRGRLSTSADFTDVIKATDQCAGDIAPVCDERFFLVNNFSPQRASCKLSDGVFNRDCVPDVTVRDTTPPAVTCPQTTVEYTGSGGATVALQAEATDACDGQVTTLCQNSGGFFPLGNTQSTCRAEDSASHVGSCQLTVTVQDTTPPDITCPGALEISATSPSGAVVAGLPAVQASDRCAAVATSCDHASGETFPLGSTTVNCTATDAVNLQNACNFNVQVSYPFTGFAQPVDAAPTVNVVSGGAGVPVRFGLGGDFGLDIFAVGYPKSQQIACDSAMPIDDVESIVTVGQSGLSYSSGANQYIYAWKTERTWGGTCRQLNLKLADGTDHLAYFRFK
jgi:hypothetical protein